MMWLLTCPFFIKYIQVIQQLSLGTFLNEAVKLLLMQTHLLYGGVGPANIPLILL